MDRSPSLPPVWADHPIDGQCCINSERLESRVEASMLHLNPYDHLTGTAYFSIDRNLEIELCGSRWISQALCAAFATLCSTSKSIAGLLMCFEKEGSVHEPIRGQIPPVPASPMAWQGKTMSARWI